MSVLLIVALSFGGLALAVTVLAVRSFRAGNRLRGSVGLLGGVLLLAVAALATALSAATRGYRALTHEEVAAVVVVRPKERHEHAFEATVHLPDRTEERTFEVRGDQVYVDARVIKWHPYLNVLGLHTAYELDRIGGRYRSAQMAQNAPRTVYPLGQQRYIEIVGLIERFPLFGEMVDAEYGSATYVDVEARRRLEVRVSTSGLLIRPEDDD